MNILDDHERVGGGLDFVKFVHLKVTGDSGAPCRDAYVFCFTVMFIAGAKIMPCEKDRYSCVNCHRMHISPAQNVPSS